MKKWYVSVLVCGIVLGLFGCGGELPVSIPVESTQETESFVESAAPSSQAQEASQVSSSSAPREMGPPITEWYFTAGPQGEEKVLLGVGDEFLGFELVELSGIDLGLDLILPHKLSATFVGEVTVTATLEYFSEFNPGFYIHLDEENARLLPYVYDETFLIHPDNDAYRPTTVSFRFWDESYDRLAEQFGMELEETECRITLTSFTLLCFERSVSDHAEFSHIEII